jgi:hypothetical protein
VHYFLFYEGGDLVFMAAAATTSSLGLDFFSSWLNALLGYVPPLLASVVIVMAGYLLGNIVGGDDRECCRSFRS